MYIVQREKNSWIFNPSPLLFFFDKKCFGSGWSLSLTFLQSETDIQQLTSMPPVLNCWTPSCRLGRDLLSSMDVALLHPQSHSTQPCSTFWTLSQEMYFLRSGPAVTDTREPATEIKFLILSFYSDLITKLGFGRQKVLCLCRQICNRFALISWKFPCPSDCALPPPNHLSS